MEIANLVKRLVEKLDESPLETLSPEQCRLAIIFCLENDHLEAAGFILRYIYAEETALSQLTWDDYRGLLDLFQDARQYKEAQICLCAMHSLNTRLIVEAEESNGQLSQSSGGEASFQDLTGAGFRHSLSVSGRKLPASSSRPAAEIEEAIYEHFQLPGEEGPSRYSSESEHKPSNLSSSDKSSRSEHKSSSSGSPDDSSDTDGIYSMPPARKSSAQKKRPESRRPNASVQNAPSPTRTTLPAGRHSVSEKTNGPDSARSPGSTELMATRQSGKTSVSGSSVPLVSAGSRSTTKKCVPPSKRSNSNARDSARMSDSDDEQPGRGSVGGSSVPPVSAGSRSTRGKNVPSSKRSRDSGRTTIGDAIHRSGGSSVPSASASSRSNQAKSVPASKRPRGSGSLTVEDPGPTASQSDSYRREDVKPSLEKQWRNSKGRTPKHAGESALLSDSAEQEDVKPSMKRLKLTKLPPRLRGVEERDIEMEFSEPDSARISISSKE